MPEARHERSRPLTIETAADSDGSAWNRFVERHPEGTVAHLFQWRRVVESAYRKRCVYLVAKTEGEISAVLPAVLMRGLRGQERLVSMPFLDEGGVLSSSAQATQALWSRALEEVDARRGAVEVRTPLRLQVGAQYAESSTRRFRLVLALPESSEELWSAISSKVRNHVRKSRKEELTTSRVAASELPRFYEVFARNMRDLGSPVHSYRFLAEIFAQFGDQVRLYLTSGRDGGAVAGAIAFKFRHTVAVPWASSLRSSRQVRSNYSLYWQALEDAVVEGASLFDFGRSTEDTGTFRFKQQWGAKAVPLHWQTYSPQGERLEEVFVDPRRHSRLVALWRKLPVPIATRLGSRIRGYLSN